MALKILLDPIQTTIEPDRCSTVIQFKTFIDRTLASRPDVFFYYLVPEWVIPDHRKWLPQDPRIKYIDVPQHRDRMNEYIALHEATQKILAFTGDYWDIDLVVTNRTGLVPLMKMLMTAPRNASYGYLKEVIVIEEMPLMSFKKTVVMVNNDIGDLFTLAGYLAADKTYLISYHEKHAILNLAREWFSPSQVKRIEGRLKESVPAQREEFRLKTAADLFDSKSGKPFMAAYVGRMQATNTNLDKVYAAMTTAWIMKGAAKVKLTVLTPSVGGTSGKPPPHIDVQRAPREEFWRICREDMHVMLVMHTDSGFSLSLIEPMMLGVPALVLEAPWAIALLGKDYPFFVKTELDAYARLKMFYEDYASEYARFAVWQRDSFVPTLKKRFAEDLLYNNLAADLERLNTQRITRYRSETVTRKGNEIVTSILKKVGPKKEFVMFDVMRELGEDGTLRGVQQKLKPQDREMRGITWIPNWNDFRWLLKAHYGWDDASVKLGHLRRV